MHVTSQDPLINRIHRWFDGIVLITVLLVASLPGNTFAQSLRGSAASMDRQNQVARQHDFTFIETPDRVRFFVSQGWLVRITSNSDFRLDNEVSFPYARAEVDLFIRRLSSQYRRACGEQLVVTSLTRPKTRQPRNASSRSVHPTGMALDLRYPNQSCRNWLEPVLSDLERAGVLEATRERRPVHYHVAVFPEQYATYVQNLRSGEAPRVADGQVYTVRSGDSLWTIARRHGTTVDNLRSLNRLNGSRINVGQDLHITESSDSREAPGLAEQLAAYTVRSGDSLWTIARRHGTTVRDLRNVNDLNGSRIFIGQVLDVPVDN